MPESGSRRLWAIAAAAGLTLACFLLIGLKGNVAFVLELRGLKAVALIQVAVAVAVATAIVQAMTGNRILSPSIMGLDALYLLGQALMVAALGGLGFASLDPRLKFAVSLAAMVLLAAGVFLPLLRARLPLYLLLLTGAVMGILFRGLAALIERMIDPNAFAVVQGASHATFTAIPPELLGLGSLITAAGVAVAWRLRHLLDVVVLGEGTAVGLGVDWRRTMAGLLMLVVGLVAVSTALVGPVVFLGLLAVAVAERLVGTQRHAVLLPAAAGVGVVILVGGQTVLQHAFGGAATLGVMVEFFGGLAFFFLLASGHKR